MSNETPDYFKTSTPKTRLDDALVSIPSVGNRLVILEHNHEPHSLGHDSLAATTIYVSAPGPSKAYSWRPGFSAAFQSMPIFSGTMASSCNSSPARRRTTFLNPNGMSA